MEPASFARYMFTVRGNTVEDIQLHGWYPSPEAAAKAAHEYDVQHSDLGTYVDWVHMLGDDGQPVLGSVMDDWPTMNWEAC